MIKYVAWEGREREGDSVVAVPTLIWGKVVEEGDICYLTKRLSDDMEWPIPKYYIVAEKEVSSEQEMKEWVIHFRLMARRARKTR